MKMKKTLILFIVAIAFSMFSQAENAEMRVVSSQLYIENLPISVADSTAMSGMHSIKAPNIKKTEPTINSDYCEGWGDGYCEGWKDVKGQFAICPITPICPIAENGKNTYKGGYNRGFKAGFRAASK